MKDSRVIIDYEGFISFETMEMILNRLRASQAFSKLRKPVRKRLYGTVVESMDNIYKYAVPNRNDQKKPQRLPTLKVSQENRNFVVTAGNMIKSESVEALRFKLDRVNQLDTEALKSLYEDVINRESSEEDNGAGLGLITMALRTEQDIRYSFVSLDDKYSYFKMSVVINE